jgi:hypothetical protein
MWTLFTQKKILILSIRNQHFKIFYDEALKVKTRHICIKCVYKTKLLTLYHYNTIRFFTIIYFICSYVEQKLHFNVLLHYNYINIFSQIRTQRGFALQPYVTHPLNSHNRYLHSFNRYSSLLKYSQCTYNTWHQDSYTEIRRHYIPSKPNTTSCYSKNHIWSPVPFALLRYLQRWLKF